MDREGLESLDKESLIRLVLAQAELIVSLTKQVEALTAANAALTARVVELEAKLGLPPKTPDNSSVPLRRARSLRSPRRRAPRAKLIRARIGRCIPTRPVVSIAAPSAAGIAASMSRRRRSGLARRTITLKFPTSSLT